MYFLGVIYALCIGLLLYTYVLYPLIIRIFQRFYTANQQTYSDADEFPFLSILIAAYNEEKVIGAKIESVISSLNAAGVKNAAIWVGSDNSSDATNEILTELSSKYNFIYPVYFNNRQGKPSIINNLAARAKEINHEHILMITDANVMFSEATIFELMKHFKSSDIAIVESNIISTGLAEKGISKSEKTYVSGEIALKHGEGKIFRVFSGPMGGCFCIRSSFYKNVPSHFLVDDFYIAMTAIEQGGKAIVEPKSVCYEAVSHEIADEIKRKSRIGTGNYQNMIRFRKLWINFPFSGISIVLFSHKIIRWIGPVLLLIALLTLVPLALNNTLFLLLLGFHIGMMIFIPLVYKVMEKLHIHFSPFRLITYFFAANFALLLGLIRYWGGRQNGIWEPTRR